MAGFYEFTVLEFFIPVEVQVPRGIEGTASKVDLAPSRRVVTGGPSSFFPLFCVSVGVEFCERILVTKSFSSGETPLPPAGDVRFPPDPVIVPPSIPPPPIDSIQLFAKAPKTNQKFPEMVKSEHTKVSPRWVLRLGNT